MSEFAEDLRRMCRNPRCRMRLPAPVSNPREAFCTRGCHTQFYRKRCLVCEGLMERKTERQLICGKRRCRNALQARSGLGRYIPLLDVVSPLKTSIKPGPQTADKGGRGWRIVAGEIGPKGFQCGMVPDGPGNQWKGGAFGRIEAANRAALKAHFAKLEEAEIAANGEFTDPDWREVVSPDGVKCFVTKFARSVKVVAKTTVTQMAIPDDLNIPASLRRT